MFTSLTQSVPRCKKRHSFSTSFTKLGTLVHQSSQLYKAKSDSCSPTHSCTHGIEVVHSIEGDHDISTIGPPVMPDPVLLQGPHVEHSDLHGPHAGNCIQYNLIFPKIMLQQTTKVLLGGQRWVPASLLIHLLLDTIK